MIRDGILLIGLLLLEPAAARAQWADAELPAKGELQLGLSALATDIERTFDADGSTRPLSDLFAVDLDELLAPELQTLDAALAGLFESLGLEAPPPSAVGLARYDVLREKVELPISITLGVSQWLALFANIPVVRNKSFSATVYDSLSAEAGPGRTAFNGDPEAALAGLNDGIAQLEAIVAADTLTSDERAQAEALLDGARTLEAGLGSLTGLEFLPTDSSAAGRQLTGFYAGLQSGFAEFEVSLPTLSLARPLSAEEAEARSSGPDFGIETPRDRDSGYRFGDIELGLSLQPINTFRPGPDRRRPTIPFRTRLDALWRFPSGRTAAPNRISEIGAGDGGADLEVRSTLDVGFGSRLWLSLSAGYKIQMEATVDRLITSPQAPIQPGAIVAPTLWDPGDVVTFVAVPRFNFTRAITFSILYVHTHHGRDAVRSTSSGAAETGAFRPSALERGTEFTARSLGFAVRYSATDWHGGRREGLPVEVELGYRRSLSASGGIVPWEGIWQVGFRTYAGLFRR